MKATLIFLSFHLFCLPSTRERSPTKSAVVEESMDTKVILSVSHMEQIKLISVTSTTSFSEYVDNLIGKWGDLNHNNFTSSCVCGSQTNICLDSQDDLQNLMLLCSLANVRIVAVKICKSKDTSPAHERVPSATSFEDSGGHTCGYPTEPVPTVNVEVQDSFKSGGHTNGLFDINIQDNNKKRMLNSGQFTEWDGEESIPCYDICPLVKKPCLLSDSWAEIMKDGVGSIFRGGAVEFRTELIKYCTQMGFKFRYKKNTARYITVVCNEENNSNCSWFIKTRRQPVTMYFEITKANFIHKCVGLLTNNDTTRISPRIMGNLLIRNVQNNPDASGKDIVLEMRQSYGLNVPYWKAYRAAEAARDQIYGNYADSYDQLRWYCEAITRTNPGSIVSLETNPTNNEFERLFIGFKACIEGFKTCRPMLFIDRTFMRGRAKGTLLAATAKDGNNGLFPVAFAVVSAENEDNWEWFLCMLRDNVKHDKQVFYISDRNKGLMTAFPRVFEDPVHFYCLYHLQQNLKGKFGGAWGAMHRKKIGNAFREAAYAPNVRIFDEKIKVFLEIGGAKAAKWIEKVPVKKWVVAHSPHITRYGEMTSNAAESFNAWIIESRSLPITHMIESIRAKISKWYVERREESDKWNSLLVQSKDNEWHYLADSGSTWFVATCPAGDFLISSTPSVRVDLSTRSCTCHQWQLKGFPCVHAVSAISRRGLDVTQYIDECYLTSHYKQCYHSDIHPIPETEKFEYKGEHGHVKILPPKLKRAPGRPKKKRMPSYGETRKNHGW